MARQLEKATITVLRGKRANETIRVLFNPKEYSFDLNNSYDEKKLPGLASPVLRFVNGDLKTLSMDLFFDTWTDGSRADVSKLTNSVANIMSIDSEIHEPSDVRFTWGKFSFKAHITAISQKFTMFNGDGTPVRATLSVTFKEYRGVAEQFTIIKPNSADKTKSRVLLEGDALWRIAEREYGDASEWRRIARANRINDPQDLRPGTAVVVPPMEENDGL